MPYCRCILTRSGSSPLTRGKLALLAQLKPGSGLIPAHAGKTHTSRAPVTSSRAHPRSRGENKNPNSRGHPLSGSSPLTRGKPCRAPRRGCCPGLIPAHAGKTSATMPSHRRRRAHPRSRGENWMSWGSSRPTPGSSPLTRGKRYQRCPTARDPGLIPAHAGKTSTTQASTLTARAHPRSRGENSVS